MTTNDACFGQPLTGSCRPYGDPDTNPWRPRFTIPEGDLEKRYGETLRCFAGQGDQVAIHLVSRENQYLSPSNADDVLLAYLPDPNTVDPVSIGNDCMDRRTEAFYACRHGLSENWLLAYDLIMGNPNASRERLMLLPKLADLAEAGGFVVPRTRVTERLKEAGQN